MLFLSNFHTFALYEIMCILSTMYGSVKAYQTLWYNLFIQIANYKNAQLYQKYIKIK